MERLLSTSGSSVPRTYRATAATRYRSLPGMDVSGRTYAVSPATAGRMKSGKSPV